MKAIVSLEILGQKDKYCEVGMNDRTIIGPYKTKNHILQKAKEFAGSRGHRIELFGDNIHKDPLETLYIRNK